MVDQVAQVGFPAPRFFALCAEMSEYAGGVLLLFGLFSRPAAFFLAFTLGTAAIGFHRVNPFIDYHITLGFFGSISFSSPSVPGVSPSTICSRVSSLGVPHQS
jgi:putative oxidoreductase